ncbi:MAG: biotin--[acetyl-CoA-carboxylase] ligase [Clostridia bacterium]
MQSNLIKLPNLNTKYLGKNAIFFNTIDSTQSEIWRIIEKENLKSGTLVMANIQTNGQGTRGRIWYTEEPNNIAFSFGIKANCNIKKLEGITIKIAETIVKIMKKMYGINLQIKFPNDIYYNNKKIGGILTQTKVINGNVKYLVIGIGINTSQQEFAEDIKEIATSIKKEFNIDVDVKKFIAEFCNEFERIVEDLYSLYV